MINIVTSIPYLNVYLNAQSGQSPKTIIQDFETYEEEVNEKLLVIQISYYWSFYTHIYIV